MPLCGEELKVKESYKSTCVTTSPTYGSQIYS